MVVDLGYRIKHEYERLKKPSYLLTLLDSYSPQDVVNQIKSLYLPNQNENDQQNNEKRKPLSQSELADQLLNEHRVKLDDFTANCATLKKAIKSAAGIKMLGKKKPTEWDRKNKKVSVVKKKTIKPCDGKVRLETLVEEKH
ncbi:unnamed protein product [Didymodactylos carnosus]|uniref:Uncharacterized protein n=1 Tax=Didymodactylos carnosus TaxID=1234261 RepID=A0A814LL45_9BILA|nr:unnamed protein product [Didymodactylos carnosus]CAF1067334.1 unnamed protein product [Didymodactylos carnosus]CAF1258136.1 unnamed protein product [Didymodactylos carnosus]CAF3834810.1 unnamed protein product [Didymodactylos carnosus]CAF3834860.1 unnamed protein product [Didymodactylos carnosus]